MNKPKRAGTAWEVAVRDYLKPRFPYIERLALGGIHDGGDFSGVPGWLIEAKVANSRDRPGRLVDRGDGEGQPAGCRPAVGRETPGRSRSAWRSR